MWVQRQLARWGMRSLTIILTTVIALGPNPGGSVQAQEAGMTISPLAQGRMEYAEAVGGPADVLLARVTLVPGAEVGWHTHPGPVVVVITQGELTLYGQDGCRVVYSAGAAYAEAPGDVHSGRNESSQPTELTLMFVLPAGAPPQVNVPAPTAACPQ
jgi:quercetin dioxygenase-like cupin family protein